METKSDRYWKSVVIVLALLFVGAVGVDAVLWYSVQKSQLAQQTLNDIVAAQPQAPKTDEDKTKLLDRMATAHQAAVDAVAAQSQKTATGKTAPAPATTKTPSGTLPNDEKTKLLNSLH